MILLSARKVWLWVQRDGGIWSFLTWTKNHSSLHRHQEVSLDVVEVETLLILQENLRDLVLELAFPYQGGSSQFLISSRKCDSSICGWKNKISIFFEKYHLLRIESFGVDFWCVHRFQLLNVCNHYVIPSKYRAHPSNNPGKTFFSNWWILNWSFAEIGWYSTSEPNGIIGPLHGSPKRLSHGGIPIRQEILNLSQIGTAFHGICPPAFI